MTSAADDLHLLLGAYALGGLSDEDRRTFSEHLRTCATCQQELGQVSGLPHLLELADPSAVAADPAVNGEGSYAAELPPRPGALPAGRGVEGLLDELARRRRRRRRWFAVAAAAATVLAFGAGTWIGPRFTDPDPPTRHVVAAAVAGSSATADVALVTRGWGTQLDLACSNMPIGEEILLWVVGADGRGASVASWRGTKSGYATVTGATALRPNEIRRVEIRTAAGKVLASADLLPTSPPAEEGYVG